MMISALVPRNERRSFVQTIYKEVTEGGARGLRLAMKTRFLECTVYDSTTDLDKTGGSRRLFTPRTSGAPGCQAEKTKPSSGEFETRFDS